MRLVCLSDTHCEQPPIPDGDILIHCGDGTYQGHPIEMVAWIDYIARQTHKYKIIVAGNHDLSLDRNHPLSAWRQEWLDRMRDAGIIYLEESEVIIDNLKYWGSPVQPEFYGWGFQKKRGEELKRHWAQIPDDVDILITLGPPLGFGDRNLRDERIGDEDLFNRVMEVKPALHLSGHAHHGYGIRFFEGIQFVNCAVLNEDYLLAREPIVIDLED